STAACRTLATFLLLMGCAMPETVSQSSPAAPHVEVQVYSVMPKERRTLSLDEFKQAINACHFFSGNPLHDLTTPSDVGYSYGGTCQGPGALAPEIKVSIVFDDSSQARVGVTLDSAGPVVD